MSFNKQKYIVAFAAKQQLACDHALSLYLFNLFSGSQRAIACVADALNLLFWATDFIYEYVGRLQRRLKELCHEIQPN